MEPLEEPADLRAEHGFERHRILRDHRHVEPASGEVRRRLHPDKAGADDDDALGILRPAHDALGVAPQSEREHAVEVAAGHVEPTRRAARGDEHAVVLQRLGALKVDRLRVGVERHDRVTAQEFDPVPLVKVVVAKRKRVVPRFPAEVAFAERRPVVGRHLLFGDDDDASLEALLTQRFGRDLPRRPAADDHERLRLRVGVAVGHRRRVATALAVRRVLRRHFGFVGDGDEHVLALDAGAVAAKRVEGGDVAERSVGHVELRVVPRAGDGAAVEHAVGERRAVVGAVRAARVECAIDTGEKDVGVADGDGHHLAVGEVVDGGDEGFGHGAERRDGQRERPGDALDGRPRMGTFLFADRSAPDRSIGVA